MGLIPIAIVEGSQEEPGDLVNMFRHMDKSGKLHLIGRYGLDLFSDIGAAPVRGRIAVNPFGYVVAGNVLYKILNDGTATPIGQIQTNSGRVGMARNETQIMITDGVTGYILTLATDAFETISSPGFSGANDTVFIDHYFAVDNPIDGTAQVSALEDGRTWNALDKATPEVDPDGLTRCMSIHSLLWMLNETTSEPWYNAQLPYGFPFMRQTGGVVDMGIAARWSAVAADNTLYWLGQGKDGLFGIVRLNGFSAEKISTPSLDIELQKYHTVLDCIAWAFTDNGHTFINFVFPSANKSWCFDPSMNLWHETRSWEIGAFRIGGHMFLNGQHILDDRLTGKLYKVNWDTYSDAGDPIESVRVCQHISKYGDEIEVPEIVFDVEVGAGKSPAEQDEDGNEVPPLMMFSYSKDRGKTYSGEALRSLGITGDYKRIVSVKRLGTAIVWTFKVRFTDPCKRTLRGASINV